MSVFGSYSVDVAQPRPRIFPFGRTKPPCTPSASLHVLVSGSYKFDPTTTFPLGKSVIVGTVPTELGKTPALLHVLVVGLYRLDELSFPTRTNTFPLCRSVDKFQ